MNGASTVKVEERPKKRIVVRDKPKSQMNWGYIESSWFCYVFKVRNGIVCWSEPLKYLIGWTIERLKEHCKEKGWELTI